MNSNIESELERLAAEAAAGNDTARANLIQILYDEIHTCAKNNRFIDRNKGTMRPTAVANEVVLAFLKRFPSLKDAEADIKKSFSLAIASAVQQVVRSHWREKKAIKRGGHLVRAGGVDMDQLPAANQTSNEFIDIDEVMPELERWDKRRYEVVMLKFYAGHNIADIAGLLGISKSTVKEDWRCAQLWLKSRLKLSQQS